MRNSGKAPTMAVWVISLVLFLVALAAHFRIARIGEPVANWSWIVGFALLLICLPSPWSLAAVEPQTTAPAETRGYTGLIGEQE